MGANSDRAADPALDDTPPSRSSSFFSRLALPLRSRARNFADFHVQPDQPHHHYSAGDHITGSVVLSVIKPVRITHLTVALHGYVRVFKNSGAAGQPGPALLSADSGPRYHGNGHASLFSDEQVLCGEGRLTARRWEFKFDLIFPKESLPSSIDFERGTISYMITATLTRPTSISPTMSTDRKVALIEKIDVGLLPPPRENKVIMSAIPKRPKRKKTVVASPSPAARNPSSSDPPDLALGDLTRHDGDSNDISAIQEEPGQSGLDANGTPRSPTQTEVHENQSEISGESVVSANSNSARGAEPSGGSVTTSRVSGGGTDEREITATVELQKGGCLPGDLLPVKIHVEHNRRIKSMHGVIVTFYRQGRVDYAPPPSLFENLSEEEARKLEREDYYPRSRTGLGGLSLSSAGSCSVFRKDLSQSVSPLIIDPNTLSANIATSVRVPENVFPSIKGVPGGLISFKYHIEVIVDLGGRLAGQTQGTPQQSGPLGGVGSMAGPDSLEANLNLGRLANWNGTIVDTDNLRREKGVMHVSFEVVVGTLDSSRSRGKAVAASALPLQQPSSQESRNAADETHYTWQNSQDGDGIYHDDTEEPISYQQSERYFAAPSQAQASYHDFHGQETPTSAPPPAPVYVPAPEVPRQQGMTEKEIVAQAEMRLLPSQPGPAAGPSEASSSQAASSSGPNTMAFEPSAPMLESDPSTHLSPRNGDEEPSAPPLADMSQAHGSNGPDDKQELERRRLLLEASAPAEAPEDLEHGEPSAPPLGVAGPSNPYEPSAPRLDEEGSYGNHDTFEGFAGPSAPNVTSLHHHHHHRGAEPLPRYER